MALFGILLAVFPVTAQALDRETLLKQYKQGDIYAAYQLGIVYRKGLGVPADPELARDWYEKAATAGVIEAQYSLAWMYSHKSQNPLDYDVALDWLITAENNPNSDGPRKQATLGKVKKRLKRFCNKGYVDFPASHPLSDDPKCWVARGEYLFRTKGSQESFSEKLKFNEATAYRQKTRDYLERALAAGELSAGNTLALIEKKGWGVSKSAENAKVYLEQAASEASGDGQLYLAKAAFKRGDMDEYIRRLALGAQVGNKRAAKTLGYEYLDGDIVKKDERLGLQYLLLSRDRNRGPFNFTGKSSTHIDSYFPFTSPPPVLVLFRRKDVGALIDDAHRDAIDFAQQYEFSERAQAEIDGHHQYALHAYNYYHPRGGVWYKSRYWTFMFWIVTPLIGLLIFRLFIWLVLRKTGVKLA